MNRLFPIIFAIFALSSCVRESVDSGVAPTPSSDKIYNWSDTAARGRLLVRVADINSPIEVEGIELTVESLFPKATGSERLDRWMLVHFDEELDTKAVAESIAALDEVERVEFDVKVKRIVSEAQPMPTSRPEPTRSVEMPFNDPELPWQWHYYNDGSLADYADDPNQCLAGADINLLNAWKYTAGDRRVVVAVVDGGIMTDHPVIEQKHTLVQLALFVKEGLPELEALKAVTINAAKTCFIDDMVGSIKEGKDADIVIWSKHPLDIMCVAETVILNGEVEVSNK